MGTCARVRYDARIGNVTYVFDLRRVSDGYTGHVTILARAPALDRAVVLALLGETARCVQQAIPGTLRWDVEPMPEALRAVRRAWHMETADTTAFAAVIGRIFAKLPRSERRAITLYYE